MTTIKASCPVCGSVELTPDDVRLVFYADTGSFYAFDCTGCASRVCKPADSRVIGLLLSAGVHVERRGVVTERSAYRPGGSPITLDDLIDFVLALGESDVLAAQVLAEEA
jgi:hypothetical protein